MKSYTDLEQSRRLAEILPIESVDMYYEPAVGFCTEPSEPRFGDIKYAHPRSIRCWSLAALRSLLPSSIEFNGETYLFDSYNTSDGVWVYQYAALNGSTLFHYKSIHDVDACYEMILMLHDNNLL